MPGATVTLLLPGRARFARQALAPAIGEMLGRADVDQPAEHPLTRVFDILPRGWPVAAVTRQRDCGDAPGAAWLRADPAYVRPDINGARLLAIGDALGLDQSQADALIKPLRPLFGDAGFPIDAAKPSRWYLKLPPGARLPTFASPADALGADLFDHLPGATDTSPEARRWRALLSEAQVVLHNHPLNAERAAAGLVPVNSLWFWGAGVLPDRVQASVSTISSQDDAVRAFAELAGTAVQGTPERWTGGNGSQVVDLRHLRALEALSTDWLLPLSQALRGSEVGEVAVEFEDGLRYRVRAGQRWRLWRRALREIPAPAQGTEE